jgi:tRNA A37 N6-isopentenylltransferase MiaA
LLYDVLFLTPEAPEEIAYREWLYDRINRRVEMMFNAGALKEVE